MSTAGGMPPVTGSRRVDWGRLPAEVRGSIERLLGGEVVAAESLAGGFSEGVAARLRLAGGRTVFLKATGEAGIARFHRQEAAITGRLPASVPAPRLLATHDDGTWVALLFEHVDGVLPAQPWRREEFGRVLEAVTAMTQALTPSPVAAVDAVRPRLGGWRSLAGHEAALDPWAAEHLDELIALEEAADLSGDSLLHGDLYPFNILLTAERTHVVDWPHAWVGPAYCDVLTLLSNAVLSGLDPRPYAERNPLTRGLAPRVIDGFLAAHSGFLLRLAVTAGPGADPHLVAMAEALGGASLRWLRLRR